ncbi:MAG: oxidoreductase [Kaistia sp. SCN 65-12]|nr:MAG: oxidoreductase [Kaistia sp. SCN 65-12]
MTPADALILSPAALLAAAAIVLTSQRHRPSVAAGLVEIAAAIAFGAAVAGAFILGLRGPATLDILSWRGLGLTVRLDIVSVAMSVLIAFIGWVVVRFSRTYLLGEPGQARFCGWLAATLASVLTMVTAGNLGQLVVAWIATSLSLHQLLLFYPDRPAAQAAARKKFVVARIGDSALIAAAVFLMQAYGSADIATILERTRTITPSGAAHWAAALLVLAALLKSAQFPSHGWLVEVMETPTPVSALLHAGVVNAGGFLLIRFADVLMTTPGALATLVMVGGFTALFASAVMLTQSAVKTSLAWSTIAQMGFMVLQCGLALFPLALLHIVAHSLYKAHAFLAANGAVERIASIARPGPVAVPGIRAVAQAFAIALAIYAVLGLLFGFAGKSPQAIALGAILILGVAYLIAQGLADSAPRALTLRTSAIALVASASYFLLQLGAVWLTKGALPAAPPPTTLEWVMIVLTVGSFGLVAFAQALFPNWCGHPAVAGLRVHLANGLYVNAILDRAIGRYRLKTSS